MKSTRYQAIPTGTTLPMNKAAAGAAPTLDVIYSNELFGRRRELLIAHAGFLYRLRITQNNKLILTK